MQQIARQLLLDDLVVPRIAVEGLDYLLHVAVRVWVFDVVVRSVRVGVTGDIEPVPAPALTVARRSEKPLHYFGERRGREIGKKGVDLLRRRRQGSGGRRSRAASGPVALYALGQHGAEGVDVVRRR